MTAKAEVIKAQIQCRQAWVQYYHARVTTGSYEDRLGHVFKGSGDALTLEELKHDELATMKQHIHLMHELSDELAKELL